jgi:hypothetical protein
MKPEIVSTHTGADAALKPHPSTPDPAVRELRAGVRRTGDMLDVSFTLTGKLTRVRVPVRRPARAVDELWRHTCFEVFCALPREARYWEFNLSPSGEWAAYAFRGYRERAKAEDFSIDPGIAVESGDSQLTLQARIELPRASTIQLGLTAVIEDADGALSYWALRHADGKPDFHNRHTFALELQPA